MYTLPDGADPEELLRQSPGLSAARARLIRALATAGQLPLAELAREASCSPSTVRAAERDGLIVKEYVTPPSGAGSSVPEGSLYGIGRGLGGRGLGDRVSLTPAQADALRAVEAAMDSGGGVLLHGVTGSARPR